METRMPLVGAETIRQGRSVIGDVVDGCRDLQGFAAGLAEIRYRAERHMKVERRGSRDNAFCALAVKNTVEKNSLED